MSAFASTLKREILLGARVPAEVINPLFFFVVVVSLFPLSLTPSPETLKLIAPGVVWVAALLAVMLSLEGLFRRDHDCGALDQLLLSPELLVLPISAKLLSHWLLTGLPLVLMAPVLGYMLHLPVEVLPVLCASLLLGTPTLTIIGAIGAALVLGSGRGGLLLALLILPLYVPVLVFGAGAIAYALEGLPVSAILAILGALLALAASLGPFAVALGLKISSGD